MKRVSVSYNRDYREANNEVDQYINEGYSIVETYWDDWDCGQILWKGESKEEEEEVLVLHKEHVKRCEESEKIRQSII